VILIVIKTALMLLMLMAMRLQGLLIDLSDSDSG
jgi:hypothetical protein